MGNIVSIASDADVRAYQYDALSRLAQVEYDKGSVFESFTYDATGNRLSKLEPDAGTVQYSYEAGTHRLSAVGGTSRNL